VCAWVEYVQAVEIFWPRAAMSVMPLDLGRTVIEL